MGQIIVTAQIIRDTLGFKGPKTASELAAMFNAPLKAVQKAIRDANIRGTVYAIRNEAGEYVWDTNWQDDVKRG